MTTTINNETSNDIDLENLNDYSKEDLVKIAEYLEIPAADILNKKQLIAVIPGWYAKIQEANEAKVAKEAAESKLQAASSNRKKVTRQSFEDKLVKAVDSESGFVNMLLINHLLNEDPKPHLEKNEKWIWSRFRTSCMVFYHAGMFNDEVNEAIKKYDWS